MTRPSTFDGEGTCATERTYGSADIPLATQGADEILRQILAILKEQEANRVKERARTERQDAQKDRTTVNSQVWSAMSVVAVFIASIAVALLGLAMSTFASRDPDAHKRTDDVINTFWYLTAFLSLVAGAGAGVGASANAFIGAGAGATIGRAISAITSFPGLDSIILRLSRMYPIAVKARQVFERLLPASMRTQSIDAEAQSTRTAGARLGVAEVQLDPAADLARRVVERFLWSLEQIMIYAVIFLIVGLLVFVWAEQTRPIAVALTVATGLVYFQLCLMVPLVHRHRQAEKFEASSAMS